MYISMQFHIGDNLCSIDYLTPVLTPGWSCDTLMGPSVSPEFFSSTKQGTGWGGSQGFMLFCG